MIYLDYAKATPNGYILNFFADKEADLADISNGKRFVTKNGMDYGVPQPSSTVVITMPDKTKKTYVLNEAGEWQEGGVDMDYSKLENAPIIFANLAEEGFVPEANTYYEHLGETTENFIKGIIYLYDWKEYKAIDGSGGGGGSGGSSFNVQTFTINAKTDIVEYDDDGSKAYKLSDSANANIKAFIENKLKDANIVSGVIEIDGEFQNGDKMLSDFSLTIISVLPEVFQFQALCILGTGFLYDAIVNIFAQFDTIASAIHDMKTMTMTIKFITME